MAWPADGRATKARGTPRGVTMICLHHFGGKRSSTRRHQELALDLGFDTYAYTMSQVGHEFAPFRADLVRIWADELRTVLDAIPGPKVIFSLSFPSMAVAGLLGERDRPDVRGWICDGGPFRHVFSCMWKYFAQEAAGQNPGRRALRTVVSYAAVGGPMYDAHAARWISRLRSGFPVLSLRAGRDQLVPAAAIDHVFRANDRLKLEVFTFADCRHLDGIRAHADQYARVVGKFVGNL